MVIFNEVHRLIINSKLLCLLLFVTADQTFPFHFTSASLDSIFKLMLESKEKRHHSTVPSKSTFTQTFIINNVQINRTTLLATD
jgi:hypothetical protein